MGRRHGGWVGSPLSGNIIWLHCVSALGGWLTMVEIIITIWSSSLACCSFIILCALCIFWHCATEILVDASLILAVTYTGPQHIIFKLSTYVKTRAFYPTPPQAMQYSSGFKKDPSVGTRRSKRVSTRHSYSCRLCPIPSHPPASGLHLPLWGTRFSQALHTLELLPLALMSPAAGS